ncbi:hypothetical protein AKO1_014558, partial [Acrasis kona]
MDQVVRLYINGFTCCIYAVAATLLLLGSICWVIYPRTAIELFRTQAAVLWIVSSSLFFVGSVFQ